MAWKWMQRIVGYLKRVPSVGVVLRPARPEACFGYEGKSSSLGPNSTVVVESITDADWAGCKRTRRSRTSIQVYVAGSMVASYVRSQRSIALSSGESEFIALVGGSSEALYIAECFRFLVERISTLWRSVRDRIRQPAEGSHNVWGVDGSDTSTCPSSGSSRQ